MSFSVSSSGKTPVLSYLSPSLRPLFPPPGAFGQILVISSLIFRVFLIALAEMRFYTARTILKGRRETVDKVTCAIIIFLGAVATVIIIRGLFLFSNRSSTRHWDDQYLQRIANALR